MTAQKKKFDDLFNAIVNADLKTTSTTTTTTKPKQTSTFDDSLFYKNDETTSKKPSLIPSTNTTNTTNNNKHAKPKDPLEEILEDDLFASLMAQTSHQKTQIPTIIKTKPPSVTKKNSTTTTNRYDDLFSNNNNNPNNTNNLNKEFDWLNALEYEGSFLKEETTTTKDGHSGLRRSRFLPSGKRDPTSAASKAAGWTQTPFKLNGGGAAVLQPQMTVTQQTNGGGGGYVPSFGGAGASKPSQQTTDKKSNKRELFRFVDYEDLRYLS